MKRLLIFLFFISFYGNSQYYEQKSGRVLCEAIGRGFSSETIADEVLEKILSIIGASKRFVIQSCDNVDNAIAVTAEGMRFIYYNKKFMSDINSATNYWSNISILAHEVGHHINGHTLIRTSLPESRKMELEADEFSGFILAKLGATLTQATQAVTLISSDEDDTYSSHPSKSKRIAAITKGYNNGSVENYKNTPSSKAEEHFYMGLEKQELKDYYGAIADYTKAIELDPNYAAAYNNRGNAKSALNDNSGAIADYDKAIELNPNLGQSYQGRGNAKQNKAIDYYGQISDYTKSLELLPNHSSNIYAYAKRGYAKFKIGGELGACKDFKRAHDLGHKHALKYAEYYLGNKCNRIFRQ